MNYEKLLEKYIRRHDCLSLEIVAEDEEQVVFNINFKHKKVILSQKGFIYKHLLNQIAFHTRYESATSFLREQLSLNELIENIVFTIIAESKPTERNLVLRNYISDDELFLDEASFFTAKKIYEQILIKKGEIDDKGKERKTNRPRIKSFTSRWGF